jgi:methionine aminopeptidase
MFVLDQVLPIKEQVEITTSILRTRLDTILPHAMRTADIDMWLIICQEDNLDPVYKTMIPMDTWPKVLQILVFIDNWDHIQRINLSMTDTKDLYEKPWSGGNLDEQWNMLREIVCEVDPKRIGVNIGSVNWVSGGLTYNLYNQLQTCLPEKYLNRLVDAEAACTKWASTLTKEQIELYPHVSAIAKEIIKQCYNPSDIELGVTTPQDLEWRFWQISMDHGLEQSFKPYYRIIREGHVVDNVVREGDLLICDVGIRYLGLYTDHQELSYIRKKGEKDAPQGLKRLLAVNNQLQGIFMDEFRHGLTGNEMLANIQKRATSEGIKHFEIFSHSIGLLVHEPGPVIGFPWDQKPIKERGDVKLDYDSCFAMELVIMDHVPEWSNQLVPCQTEHLVKITEDGCELIDEVQTEYHLI